VIGCDDTPSAEFSAPRLTSVHMPRREPAQSIMRRADARPGRLFSSSVWKAFHATFRNTPHP
jgi:hypothetical protein